MAFQIKKLEEKEFVVKLGDIDLTVMARCECEAQRKAELVKQDLDKLATSVDNSVK